MTKKMYDVFADNVSAQTPNWSRETLRGRRAPGSRLLHAIRKYHALRHRKGPVARLGRMFWAAVHSVWSTRTQCEIPLGTRIAGGLHLPHPNGIIVNRKSEIGPNCLIFQQVTLAGAVTLGGHVDVGAGAKLLGPIKIGDHVRIGANAVVTRDVPSGCDAVGVPARIVRRNRRGDGNGNGTD